MLRLHHGSRSVVLVRKAKNSAIAAEITEKSLLVSHDLGLFCLSDEYKKDYDAGIYEAATQLWKELEHREKNAPFHPDAFF